MIHYNPAMTCGLFWIQSPASLFGFEPSLLVGKIANVFLDIFKKCAPLGDSNMDVPSLLSLMASKSANHPGQSWRVGLIGPVLVEESVIDSHRYIEREQPVTPAAMTVQLCYPEDPSVKEAVAIQCLESSEGESSGNDSLEVEQDADRDSGVWVWAGGKISVGGKVKPDPSDSSQSMTSSSLDIAPVKTDPIFYSVEIWRADLLSSTFEVSTASRALVRLYLLIDLRRSAATAASSTLDSSILFVLQALSLVRPCHCSWVLLPLLCLK